MKLKIVFKDGKEQILNDVLRVSEMEENVCEELRCEIMPLEIDRKIFEKSKLDEKQEKVRMLIVDAFTEVDKNPEKYAAPFCTWVIQDDGMTKKTCLELMQEVDNVVGHMADWVEQALEWAQQIANGESWEMVCNTPDNSMERRLILWKDGRYRIVGGSKNDFSFCAPAYIHNIYLNHLTELKNTVPLIVKRK